MYMKNTYEKNKNPKRRENQNKQKENRQLYNFVYFDLSQFLMSCCAPLTNVRFNLFAKTNRFLQITRNVVS